jgi:hypothetical protein
MRGPMTEVTPLVDEHGESRPDRADRPVLSKGEASLAG